MYDLIIVGGGPAGLTAAIYAIRKRLNVLLLTKDFGGKTNFRLALPWIHEYQVVRGLETVSKFRSELEYLDFARQMDDVQKVSRNNGAFSVSTKGGQNLATKSVIIATGARQVRMDVPGEKEFTMKGLCYSALSYAPLFIDKTTVVIGDGDLALRSGAELATVAKHVYMACTSDKAFRSPLGGKLKQDYRFEHVGVDRYHSGGQPGGRGQRRRLRPLVGAEGCLRQDRAIRCRCPVCREGPGAEL